MSRLRQGNTPAWVRAWSTLTPAPFRRFSNRAVPTDLTYHSPAHARRINPGSELRRTTAAAPTAWTWSAAPSPSFHGERIERLDPLSSSKRIRSRKTSSKFSTRTKEASTFISMPAPEADSREVMAGPRRGVTRTIAGKARLLIASASLHPIMESRDRCIRPPQPQIVRHDSINTCVARVLLTAARRLCFSIVGNENLHVANLNRPATVGIACAANSGASRVTVVKDPSYRNLCAGHRHEESKLASRPSV